MHTSREQYLRLLNDVEDFGPAPIIYIGQTSMTDVDIAADHRNIARHGVIC